MEWKQRDGTFVSVPCFLNSRNQKHGDGNKRTVPVNLRLPIRAGMVYTNHRVLQRNTPAPRIRVLPKIVKSRVPGPPVEGSSYPGLLVTVSV